MSETTDLAEDARRIEWLAGRSYQWKPSTRIGFELFLGDLVVGGVHFASGDFRRAVDMAREHAWETANA